MPRYDYRCTDCGKKFEAILTIMGFKAYRELPRESSPDVKIPYVKEKFL